MMLTPKQMLVIIVLFWLAYGAVYYSIKDRNAQLKKARHRTRMRGKIIVIEGGKSNEQSKDKT